MEIKSIKNWQKHYEYIKQENRWIPLAIFIVTGLKLLSELIARLHYELSGPFNWDTSLYWAVGKGILNGFPPYQELFENKPPGIFFISALSSLFKSGLFFGNFLQACMLIIVALAPVLYLKSAGFTTKQRDSVLYFFMAITFGLLLSLYTAERSGEIQIESFGAAFVSLYVITLAGQEKINRTRASYYIYFLISASLFLLVGLGMKEPFVSTALASALILCKNYDDFKDFFLMPLAGALILGVFILFFTNLINPYLNIYLPFMLNHHITANGEPLQRAWDFIRLFHDLNQFAIPLGALIFGLAGLYLFIELSQVKKTARFSRIFLVCAKFLLIAFLTLFSIGVGGYFFSPSFCFRHSCFH